MPKKIIERPLDDEERAAIADLSSRTRAKLKLAKSAKPEKVIAAIGAFIDSVRKKKRALNDVPDQMSVRNRDENTSILLFNMVVAGRTPETKKNSYTPFG